MAILQALEINSTLFLQFILAAGCFMALSSLVFAPYAQALWERERRTRGGEADAIELTKQAADIRSRYEMRAREMNSEVKTIFDSYRDESNKEYESIVSKARAESQKLIEENRKRVSAEISEASKRLKDEVPMVAQAILTRLLRKA